MTTLTSLAVSDLLAAFRSSSPTPGGGSGAALAGAVGASLLAMVTSLPKPRAATEEDLERLDGARARTTVLAAELEKLIDRDSEAYDSVVAAYRLPRGSDVEKAVRSDAIQAALKVATTTPLEVMRACGAAIEQGTVAAAFGNANASSDVGVALDLLVAGLRGARRNVEINLGSVKDTVYVSGVAAEAERLERDAVAASAAALAALRP